MNQAAKTNKPALSGCLIALAVVILGSVVALAFAWNSISGMVEQASQDVEKDMIAAEEQVRSLPASDVQPMSFADLLAAFKADKAAAQARYNGKMLEISGFVNSMDMAKSLPIKL